jgi:hypothetical protein
VPVSYAKVVRMWFKEEEGANVDVNENVSITCCERQRPFSQKLSHSLKSLL